MGFYLKIGLMLLTCFLIRPSAFGQQFTAIGIAVSLFTLLLHLHQQKGKGLPVKISSQNLSVIIMTSLLFTLLSLHVVLVNSNNNLDFVLKALIAHIAIIISFGIILSNEESNITFFRWFIKILLLFVFSYYVTLLLSIFIPLNSLQLFKLNIKGYEGTGNTYFPFTILYSFMSVGENGFKLPRLLGLFRESGILQMFMIWSLFNLKRVNMNKPWVKVTLFLGILASFSTAGVAVLFINLVISFILNKKLIRAAVFVIFAYLAIFYTPFIGVNAKMDTHGASISDRYIAVENSLNSLKENPLGIGLYNATGFNNSGINLVAASSMIGIQGFLLAILTYLIPMIFVQNKRSYFLSVSPLLITSLTSQPILDAPLVYVMMMALHPIYAKQEMQNNKKKLINNSKYNKLVPKFSLPNPEIRMKENS
ncbi:hypothetical protein ACTHSJ_16015 [Paenibacillus cellulositrophicus]|uniref:hypothetical protein n=1 Tax=Paenibacillus cellulositrophicus TaxID=562959 RepID=UPI003F7E07DF